jgi:hypothetical protein
LATTVSGATAAVGGSWAKRAAEHNTYHDAVRKIQVFIGIYFKFSTGDDKVSQ